MSAQQTMAAALAHVAAKSGERVFPPTLLPARTILELSGEAVRSRLCTFADASGVEVCLRPDMTTPIAAMVASGELAAARYHYAGSVYRLPESGAQEAIEFSQVGFEWFGGGGASEDVDATETALGAAAAGGVSTATLSIGDVALYGAVVDALPFSALWRDRLKRAFFRRRGPRDLLRAVDGDGGQVSALGAALASLSETDAGRAVEEIFTMSGVQPVGGRSAEEIAGRLREAATERVPDAAAAMQLIAYLDLRAPVASSAAKIDGFARSAGIDISIAIDGLVSRLDGLKASKPPFWKTAAFNAETGRRFEYYDGIVFELSAEGAAGRVIAAGGRYDGLVERLGGKVGSGGAIGAALRVDRMGQGAKA